MKKGGGRRTPERSQGKPPGKSGVNKGIKAHPAAVQRGMKPQDTRSPTQRQKM